MKSTPSSAFIAAAVCTAALVSNTLAGGHGHHRGPGSHPRMMPDDPMMMMNGKMTAAQRDFFVNESKAPIRDRVVTQADAEKTSSGVISQIKDKPTQNFYQPNGNQPAAWIQNATNHHRNPKPAASAAPGNPTLGAPLPPPIPKATVAPAPGASGELPQLDPPALLIIKRAPSTGSPGG
jgi:hypothetical protein